METRDKPFTGDPNRSPVDMDFTLRAHESFYDTVDQPSFQSDDARLIYHTLCSKMELVRFGDYLKRYIYLKAKPPMDFSTVPLTDYVDIICAEFSERQVPVSFVPTKASTRNMAKNWLQQQSVSRDVVLLLGFGLNMSIEDVNDFLIKGLHDAQLNSKDPLEVICWFCYRFGYGFTKFEILWEQYQHQMPASPSGEPLDTTLRMQHRMLDIADEKQLMAYLAGLSIHQGSFRQSMAARQQFDLLFEKAKEMVAQIKTQLEAEAALCRADHLREDLEHDKRLYDYQKADKLKKARENYHVFHPDELGPGDVEQMLFAAIPRDVHGNMLPMKKSALRQQFNGKRLTRQRMGQILMGKEQVTRYDLLTLHFFVFSQTIEQYKTINERYHAFVASADQIMAESGMGAYYLVNPYECFLQMCMISPDPLGTFSDVWEMSYQENGQE